MQHWRLNSGTLVWYYNVTITPNPWLQDPEFLYCHIAERRTQLKTLSYYSYNGINFIHKSFIHMTPSDLIYLLEVPAH